MRNISIVDTQAKNIALNLENVSHTLKETTRSSFDYSLFSYIFCSYLWQISVQSWNPSDSCIYLDIWTVLTCYKTKLSSGFWISPVRRLHNLSGQPVSMCDHAHKKVLPHVLVELLVHQSACCLLSFCLAQSKRAWIHPIETLPSVTYRHGWGPPTRLPRLWDPLCVSS